VICPRQMAMALIAASAASTPSPPPWPWAYNWSRFPAAWFGANATQWEDASQIAAIGRYSLAILGWQHLARDDNMTAVIYPQLAQAAIIKAAHPALPIFVYTSFGWAFTMNEAVRPIMHDHRYRDFFLQSGSGFEYSYTNCQQMHLPSDDRCVGYFWNFANASARDYFVEKLVRPLAIAPDIAGVFFDAVNFAYDIPEYKPWGRHVTNVPNCSMPATPGGAVTWSGCEALLNGTLDVARRTAELLNAHGKVPMLANPASFARPRGRHIWLDEARLVKAMAGLRWQTYYESFRGDAPPTQPADSLPNMLTEEALGVPAVVHTYYKHATDEPTPHIAAFLLARSDHWYFLGSTGWWDASYHWSRLYDACGQCGRPLGPATNSSGVLRRAFAGCKVSLDCSAAKCVGDVQFGGG